MPFKPNKTGSKNIIVTWNTSVRKNEMAAETPPLFSAVKNEEAKILNPLIK